jgi:dihydroxyacetone kinase-like protein
MKKFLNQPGDYVNEMLEGLCAAHPGQYRQLPGHPRVVLRAAPPRPGKVGIVTGGGSGHLPMFVGYVGPGLLDACAVGNVFAGQTVADAEAAMRAVSAGAGVLQLYGNYGGDKMNFNLAAEALQDEGVEVRAVRVADDVASAVASQRHLRRGVAGMAYAFKLAGACAEAGGDLEEVAAVAQQACDSLRSVGVALSPCTIPEAGRPGFDIGADDMAFGMGIHGEPGLWTGPLQTADQVAQAMLEAVVPELGLSRGDRVSVMVNSLGATPLEELYILYRAVERTLRSQGQTVVAPLIGQYATSMEMAGASLTVLRLDGRLEPLLLAPASSPFWRPA